MRHDHSSVFEAAYQLRPALKPCLLSIAVLDNLVRCACKWSRVSRFKCEDATKQPLGLYPTALTGIRQFMKLCGRQRTRGDNAFLTIHIMMFVHEERCPVEDLHVRIRIIGRFALLEQQVCRPAFFVFVVVIVIVIVLVVFMCPIIRVIIDHGLC